MPRIAYVNGRYCPYPAALIHIDDRGYQFADAVYEVIAVLGGALIDEARHLARLGRSLAALDIAPPLADAALGRIMREVIRRNRVRQGTVYLQISRGVAPRDHAFPPDTRAQIVVAARRKKPLDPALIAAGVAVITMPDIRWGRCDIKSTALLANVLGKEAARRVGAYEAWQIRDGMVTEGTASNAWIVTQVGAVVTRARGSAILPGVTREVVIELARESGLVFEERDFSRDEALAAAEAFLTSTTSHVLPVVRIDDTVVGAGVPGPFTLRLLDRYRAHLAAQSGAL